MDVQADVNLQQHNTMGVPSRAEFYSRCLSEEDILKSLLWARDQHIKSVVLGEGSNVLLPENLPGLVIQPDLKSRTVVKETQGKVNVCFGAGENWHNAVQWCVAQGYSGIENLALIPGTVGAAPIQNIGAYGVELDSVFESLTAIDKMSGDCRTFNRDECEFAYRNSVFKNRYRNAFVITTVTLSLNKTFFPQVSYAPLDHLANKAESVLTAKHIFDWVCDIRRHKLPDPATMPNSGSFFKNPIVKRDKYEGMLESYPDVPGYQTQNQVDVKIPAAWLIDRLGWKQKKQGDVQVHRDQALVICNPKRQPLSDVLAYAHRIQDSVQSTFGIQLEIEPQRLG